MSKISDLMHTDIGGLLAKVNVGIERLAAKTQMNTTVFYILAIALALVLGLWAMRLIKPISALVLGGIGYLAGTELFAFLTGKVGFMAKWPAWGKYIIGGLLALLLAFLAWKKCLHAVLVAYAVAGYYLAINCIVDNIWVGIAGALLLALIAACVVRFAFILAFGTASAYVLVLSLGKLLPKVDWLQLTDTKNIAAIVLFVVVAVVLTLIQRETTRSYSC